MPFQATKGSHLGGTIFLITVDRGLAPALYFVDVPIDGGAVPVNPS